jgi:MFS superfamily sulfate permease-like transporter
MTKTQDIPATGLKGLVQNWRSDLVAAISVALVAMPLSLGIAVASGVQPIAGIISAIIAGVVTTFVRGGHLAITGPAAGLIAVIIAGISAMDDGSGRAFNYVLAAIIVSGAIQSIMGLLRLGRFANIFPSSVIHGILAAIGVIIFSKQMHVAMGTSTEANTTIGILADVFHELPNANPFVAIISILGLLLMVFHSRLSYKLFHFLPAPIWVLLLSLPFVYAFDFFNEHIFSLLGRTYKVGPDLLIDIPSNLLDGIVYPDFGMIGTGEFWLTVLSLTLVSAVITLAAAKAVDKMDPYKRTTDLNKDLVGVGLASMIAGSVGGLPIITVIVRSTVNVHNHAKTKWSNLYHSLLILVFVLAMAPVLQKVPLAALAVILVYTGFKLASPKVFKRAYDQGVEQLIFLTGTLIITLYTNILYGLAGGILLALTLHMLLAKVGVVPFFKKTLWSGSKIYVDDNGAYDIKLKGISNFLSVLNLNRLLEQVPSGSVATIDLSQTRLVDLSVMENIIEFKRTQEIDGGSVTIMGLDHHVSSNSHNRALKIIAGPPKQRITPRQIRLQKIANENGWSFQKEVDWNTSYLRNFHFFDSRPIERKTNSLKGRDEENHVDWEIADLRFDEGALLSSEVYQTTIQIIHLSSRIPEFTIEKEGLFDRIFNPVRAFSDYGDIDFAVYPDFSKKFLLMGKNSAAIRQFFNKNLISFLENNEIHHIESNGESLMIFKYLHFARTDEVKNMLSFSHDLIQHMQLNDSSPSG